MKLWLFLIPLLLLSCYSKKDVVGSWQGRKGYHFMYMTFTQDGTYERIAGVERDGILVVDKAYNDKCLYKVIGKRIQKNQSPYDTMYWIKYLKNDTMILNRYVLQKREQENGKINYVWVTTSSDTLRRVP